MSFLESLAVIAGLRPGQLNQPSPQGPDGFDRRFPLMRIHTEEEVAAATTRAPSRPLGIEARAQAAFGDLRGLLAGVPEEVLYEHPWAGWGIADVLDHCWRAERRNIEYVAHLLRQGPAPVPAPAAAGRGEDWTPAEVELSLTLTPDPPRLDGEGWIQRLAGVRAEAVESARALGDEDLARPAVWAGSQVTLEFRMTRFGPHYHEHAIECEKLLQALGWWPLEGRQIARRISASRGAHELFTPAETLAGMDRRLASIAEALSPSARERAWSR